MERNGLRIKRGTWTRGDWFPTYVHDQQKQQGAEYQHYMYDASGHPLCAGVTRHEHMNRAIANQIRKVWLHWRKEYVAMNPGNYPTSRDEKAGLVPAMMLVFPINADPKTGEWFRF